MGELKKSDVCTGYGLGPSCIACCVVDATVCQRNKEFEENFDMHFFLYRRRWNCDGGIYSQRKDDFFKSLEENTQNFRKIENNGELTRILEEFQKIDRYNPQDCTDPEAENRFYSEFFGNTGFLGLIDGKAGCLLRGKYDKYLHVECKEYACHLVSAAEQNPNIHKVMKEFIQKEKPDSFLYSRIIHILAHHIEVHPAFSINRDNLTLDNLLYLKEFVQSKSGMMLGFKS